ncbi:hypothetical protein [Streptacidiphilus fuscans]|uniref:Uncharacterized protein n=1 Tax=Streptacidiphilus fuscans TaxID=2789292 RepID=A0A931B890_9ACTN|nr:hypothetical protein [Streptacidiphilus fuscans]MBF9070846.1 hypothetical protein [Streptacidiphilus fuscans]
MPTGSSGKKTSRRGAYIALGVAGWLVLAAGTAGAVVAAGGSGSGSGGTTAAAASPSPVASADAKATPSPKAAPTTAAPASPTPTPGPTVKGSVSGSVHSGDLRYFLLPVPDGAQVYNDVNGASESCGDIAKVMSDPSTSRSVLDQLGCQGGATRSFLTNDGVWTVKVELIHFDGPGHASDWVSGLSFSQGDSFSVSGISDAKGQSFAPSSSTGGNGQVIGVSHVGDVEYEIDITGSGTPSRSLLTQLMQRQEQRLSTGQ